MNTNGVATLAQALLYEGYLLYPYRKATLKNCHRWMLGTLYPRSFAEQQNESDPWAMRTECLVCGDEAAAHVEARVRFLHLVEPPIERDVHVSALSLGGLRHARERITFALGAEPVELRGTVELGAERIDDRTFKLSLRVANLTPFAMPGPEPPVAPRDAALRYAFASAHVLLGVQGGEFVSLVDPPAHLRNAAAGCRNAGLWPVLVGPVGTRNTMLAAPIILDDYPQVAPESPGDFFDATEIDELLTLRVLTLTENEKAAMRAADPRAHALLARTEALAEPARGRLHGTARTLRPGGRVRLAPRPGGDIFDLALAGRIATVIGIEEDYDGRVFVAVTVDDDPGRDLGMDGRPGHRFFFRPEELEALP